MDCPSQGWDGLRSLFSDLPHQPAACQASPLNGKAEQACCLYLLLLQADHRAIAATPPLPLESRNFLCFDAQDFLVLLVLQFQFLCVKEQP